MHMRQNLSKKLFSAISQCCSYGISWSHKILSIYHKIITNHNNIVFFFFLRVKFYGDSVFKIKSTKSIFHSFFCEFIVNSVIFMNYSLVVWRSNNVFHFLYFNLRNLFVCSVLFYIFSQQWIEQKRRQTRHSNKNKNKQKKNTESQNHKPKSEVIQNKLFEIQKHFFFGDLSRFVYHIRDPMFFNNQVMLISLYYIIYIYFNIMNIYYLLFIIYYFLYF